MILINCLFVLCKFGVSTIFRSGAFVCRGGVEIAKFAIFRDKSRNRRFSAKNCEIDNFPRQIAI